MTMLAHDLRNVLAPTSIRLGLLQERARCQGKGACFTLRMPCLAETSEIGREREKQSLGR